MWMQSEEFTGRKCKDVIWAALLCVALAAALIVFAISVQYGDPNNLPTAAELSYREVIFDWATEEIAILHRDLPIIMCALSAALIATFFWIQLLKRASHVFIALSILLFALATAFIGMYAWNLAYSMNSSLAYLAAIMAWTLMLAVLVVSYILREKIKFTADVMHLSGKVLQKIPTLIAVPFLTSLLYLFSLGMWILGLIYLFSIGTEATTIGSVEYYILFQQNIRWLFLIQFVVGLWCFSLFSAIEQYIVARMVYAFQEESLEFNSRKFYFAAVRESLTTSLGSLAFGSIISAVAEFLSFFVKYSGIKGKFNVPQFCCLQMWSTFAQYLVQWTNGFSYVYVAARGYSFSQASFETYKLLRENMSRIAVASLMVNYLLIVGALFFTFLIGGVTLYIIEVYHYRFGLVSVLLTFFSIYLLFHIAGRLILVTVNATLVYLFENRREVIAESQSIQTLLTDYTQEQLGNVVHI